MRNLHQKKLVLLRYIYYNKIDDMHKENTGEHGEHGENTDSHDSLHENQPQRKLGSTLTVTNAR